MDAKEAIWNLEDLKNDNQKLAEYRGDIATVLKCDRYNNAIDVAAEALEKVPVLEAENARLREKETPKAISKRTYNFRGEEVGICPNNHKVTIYDNYCHICGQKIDWSSDKE